jgi:transposase
MTVKTLGIDLAKNIFQLHGIDEHGKAILRKRLSRKKLPSFVAQLKPCLIGLEACSGAHYWARRFREFGHEVKLISPQFVKPYVKSNKNDYNDAEAICEAVTRPNMRFVAVKSVQQHDIQALHRIRERLIADRTALANQIRGLLAEYGITLPKGIQHVRKEIPFILENAENELTDLGREFLADSYARLKALDEHVAHYQHRLTQIHQTLPICKNLSKIQGVGPLIATSLVAAVGDANSFKNGRQFAAWLGLVPRQNSSGGKTVLLGISKRGNRYLRGLLIHGARAVLRYAPNKTDQQSRWLMALENRRGKNIAVVAMANKTARILWAEMTKAENYLEAA